MRFAGLGVGPNNRDISLVGLGDAYGGYYDDDLLLPRSEHIRMLRADKRQRPTLLLN